MYETKYYRAKTLQSAATRMSVSEDAKYISGGQTLIPTMKQRLAAPSDLIDLRHIPKFSRIKVTGSKVKIGAGVTHFEVATSKKLSQVCPALCELAAHIGDPHVRHMGTIGGSISNNDPAADYPAAILALDAEIKTNKRKITADAFFVGLFETVLDEDEIVIEVCFKPPQMAAYSKFPNPASRYAMAGVFVSKSGTKTRVAVTGAGNDGVYRHFKMEKKLAKKWSSKAVAKCRIDESEMLSDLHGDGEYRANLVKVMAKRAVDASKARSD